MTTKISLEDLEIPKKFNVLVTGTPGSGKTSLCAMLQDELGLNHIEIGKLVKDEKFYTEFDAAFDSYIVEEEDEDRLLDYLEPVLVRGGCVVDYHSCSLFPKRWFGLVIVLRADNTIVFDRLTKRGYSEEKVSENVEAEILGVVEQEAKQSFDSSITISRQSNELHQMFEAVEIIRKAMTEWTPEKQMELTAKAVEEQDDEEDDDDGDYEYDYDQEEGEEGSSSSSSATAAATSNNNNNNNNNSFGYLSNDQQQKMQQQQQQQHQQQRQNQQQQSSSSNSNPFGTGFSKN